MTSKKENKTQVNKKNESRTKLRREEIDKINSLELKLDSLDKKDYIKETTIKKKEKNKFKIKLPFWSKHTLNRNPSISYLITMLFPNGTLKTWAIKTKNSLFHVGKKTYYLYYEEAYFDISMNQYHLIYHYNFPVPINREVQESVDEGNEAFFMVKPDNLQGVIDMNYIKKISGGEDKKKTALIIILIIGLVIALGYIMLKSGGG